MVIGNFNKILIHHEKICGQQRNDQLMHNLRDALVKCGLVDLGYIRDLFTMSNKHENATYTK